FLEARGDPSELPSCRQNRRNRAMAQITVHAASPEFPVPAGKERKAKKASQVRNAQTVFILQEGDEGVPGCRDPPKH
ncbi:hypothetical protein ACC783_38885, partial [Rhizobium ruizarguesonis]